MSEKAIPADSATDGSANRANSPSVHAYIGLGSNLAGPTQQLQQAIEALKNLPQTDFIACSAFYRSAPMGPQDQDDFINAVAHLQTQLSPLELLDELQAIETRQRRTRERHWGPRTLDLDLLIYGQESVCHPRLMLPHPGIKQRDFVLVPLCEIAPELKLPDGQSIAGCLKLLRAQGENHDLRQLSQAQITPQRHP